MTPPNLGAPIQNMSAGAQQQAQGMKTAALVLLILGAALCILGLFPCLGWINWFGVPLNGGGAVIGIVGLTSGPKDVQGQAQDSGIYIAAIVVGSIGLIVGTIRCILGAGVL